MKKVKINKKALALLTAGFVLTGCTGNANTKPKEEVKIETEIEKDNPKEEETKVIETKTLKTNRNFYVKEKTNLKDIDGNAISGLDKYDVGREIEKIDNESKVKIKGKIGYVDSSKIDVLTGTYAIADISSQELKVYEEVKVLLETPIVSGKLSSPSTIGCFKIYSKTRNRYLKGPGYQSYVDIMMKYHNGEGLHDAEYHTDYDKNGKVIKRHGWRNKESFGGTTYMYHGSHGCLNMPHDAAIEAGKYLEVGDKVLVKE